MFQYQKTNTLLKVSNVSLKYGEKQILKDINFEVKDIIRPDVNQGQVISLIGASGKGKTRLFRIMAGLEEPTTGEVLTGVEQTKVKRGDMGVVTQNYMLFNHRKIKKNLELSAEKNPLIKDIQAEIQLYAEKFNLLEQLPKLPKQLSGGQQQRVSIIQQLLNGSNFLLLDEPFSGLDFLVKQKVINTLLEVSKLDSLKTLVIVSHDIESSVILSDSVLILADAPDKVGATIVKEIDLIERGLAWEVNMSEKPMFKETIKEIKSLL